LPDKKREQRRRKRSDIAVIQITIYDVKTQWEVLRAREAGPMRLCEELSLAAAVERYLRDECREYRRKESECMTREAKSIRVGVFQREAEIVSRLLRKPASDWTYEQARRRSKVISRPRPELPETEPEPTYDSLLSPDDFVSRAEADKQIFDAMVQRCPKRGLRGHCRAPKFGSDTQFDISEQDRIKSRKKKKAKGTHKRWGKR
jgi:hypothetical protein